MTSAVEAWSAVMADVLAVRKDETNQHQGFSFRGIDAVVNAVGPALRTHGVVVLPTLLTCEHRDVEVGRNRTVQRETTVTVGYRIVGPDGDSLDGASVPGEAMDSGDKGTAKAMSVAYRTFLIQALTIPTDEPDPDEHVAERATAEPELLSDDQKAELDLLADGLADDHPKRVKWLAVRDKTLASGYDGVADALTQAINDEATGGAEA